MEKLWKRERQRGGARRLLIPVCALTVVGLSAAACSSVPKVSAAKAASRLVAAGLAAEKAGEVNTAFSDFEQAQRKDPTNEYADYNLGYIYQERSDTRDAAIEYRRALLIDPNFEQALYNMGVLETTVDVPSAIAFFEQDLQVDPNNASANFDLGVLLIKQGLVHEGDTYLAKALQLDPSLSSDLPPGIKAPSKSTSTPPTSTTTTTKA